MTPLEKVDKIKEAEHMFLRKIEELKRDYWKKVKKFAEVQDQQRVESIKKELGMPQ